MTNLVNHFKNLISNDLFLKLSIYLDERDSKLRKTIEASICTVLVGIMKTKDFDSFLLSLNELDTAFEHQLNDCYSKENLFSSGLVYLEKLFPSKKERISEMISNEICVKSETARAILNLASILVINNLKKDPPKNLLSLLESQTENLYRFLPRGVKLILGLPNEEYTLNSSFEKESTLFGFSFFRLRK